MANGICMPAGSPSKSTTSASTKPQKHKYLSGRGARGVQAVRVATRGYRLAFGAKLGCAEPWWPRQVGTTGMQKWLKGHEDVLNSIVSSKKDEGMRFPAGDWN